MSWRYGFDWCQNHWYSFSGLPVINIGHISDRFKSLCIATVNEETRIVPKCIHPEVFVSVVSAFRCHSGVQSSEKASQLILIGGYLAALNHRLAALFRHRNECLEREPRAATTIIDQLADVVECCGPSAMQRQSECGTVYWTLKVLLWSCHCHCWVLSFARRCLHNFKADR